jgi:hypothetical protein
MKTGIKIENIEFNDSSQEVEFIYFFPEDEESRNDTFDSNKFDAHLFEEYKDSCNDECEARLLFENDRVIVKNDIIIKFLEKENVI